jgi:hypothetical protein
MKRSTNPIASTFIDLATFTDTDKYLYEFSKQQSNISNEDLLKLNVWSSTTPVYLPESKEESREFKKVFDIIGGGDILQYIWLEIHSEQEINLKHNIFENISIVYKDQESGKDKVFWSCDSTVLDFCMDKLPSDKRENYKKFSYVPIPLTTELIMICLHYADTRLICELKDIKAKVSIDCCANYKVVSGDFRKRLGSRKYNTPFIQYETLYFKIPKGNKDPVFNLNNLGCVKAFAVMIKKDNKYIEDAIEKITLNYGDTVRLDVDSDYMRYVQPFFNDDTVGELPMYYYSFGKGKFDDVNTAGTNFDQIKDGVNISIKLKKELDETYEFVFLAIKKNVYTISGGYIDILNQGEIEV